MLTIDQNQFVNNGFEPSFISLLRVIFMIFNVHNLGKKFRLDEKNKLFKGKNFPRNWQQNKIESLLKQLLISLIIYIKIGWLTCCNSSIRLFVTQTTITLAIECASQFYLQIFPLGSKSP